MRFSSVMNSLHLSQRDIARGTGLSKSTVSRFITHGQWPARNGARARQKVEAYLRAQGATEKQLLALSAEPAKKLAPASLHLAKAVSPVSQVQPETQEEEAMLLQNQALTFEAKEHFAIKRNPFVDEVNTRADVFTSSTTATGSMRYVRQALLEAAQNHGFLAVVGESGSGKTTLREEFEERIREEKKPIIVIKPYIVGMEANDVKGKTMKVGQIADAIARTLSPGLTLKSSPDARFEQVKQLLISSAASGFSHLIVIEEAHRLPQATLRHLKGFMEVKEGLRRLVGVCLIGQPELDHLLGANQREIREIVQRCERVTLAPIDKDLEAYLAHKFERVGLKASSVLAPDAYDAIRAKLEYVPRGGTRKDVLSVCFPLVVNNLVCAAMNLAAERGWPHVDAQVVGAC